MKPIQNPNLNELNRPSIGRISGVTMKANDRTATLDFNTSNPGVKLNGKEVGLLYDIYWYYARISGGEVDSALIQSGYTPGTVNDGVSFNYTALEKDSKYYLVAVGRVKNNETVLGSFATWTIVTPTP